MRVMALDCGAKAIGIALSDELRLTARPLTTLQRKRQSRNQIIAQLQQLIIEHEVGEVVIGLPLRMDGTVGEAAERMQVFINLLQAAVTVPIHAQDERLTSRAAEEMMHEMGFNIATRKEKSDEYAALVILRDYLASHP